MIGYPEPAKNADAVLAFETAIAKVSWPAADRRDIDKVNNPMSVAELQALRAGAQLGRLPDRIVASPSAITRSSRRRRPSATSRRSTTRRRSPR